jgi:hypothetical protein
MKPPAGTTDIVVLFSLPFPVHVPDTVVDGQSASIRPEIYVAGDPPAGIQLILRMRAAGVAIASPMELEGGDPFGRYSTSDVQVRYNLEASPGVAELEHNEVVEQATAAVNRLLEHYRDLANQPLIRRVSAADLGHFTIRYLQGGKGIQDVAHATGHGPLRGRSQEEIETLDAQLRGRLQQVDAPALFRELELRAHQLYYERDYRGAVIEAAILFESWLKAFVRQQFALRGLPPDRIEAKLRTNERQYHNAKHVAQVLLKEATGFDFGVTADYTTWRRQVADVRNDLVHGTRHVVTEAEAAACFAAVHNAKEAIMAAAGRAAQRPSS